MSIWLSFGILIICVLALVVFFSRRPAAQVPLEEAERPQLQEVRPLEDAARERYLAAWESLRTRFAEEPEATLRAADHLLQDVMRDRGYPTGDFGKVSGEISPEDAAIIVNYRAAHRICVKCETGSISDEEARQAADALQVVFESLTR